MTDPIRAALDDLPPADIVPRSYTRPDKATVAALLALHGQPVTTTRHHVTDDADGIPSWITVDTQSATLDVSQDALGWTFTELDDPTITE